MDVRTSDQRGISENLRNLADQSVSETVIVIRAEEEEAHSRCAGSQNDNANANRDPNGATIVLVCSEAASGEGNSKDLKDCKHSCVMDVKSGGGGKGKMGENLDAEIVCRICHLSSNPSSESPTNTSSISIPTPGLIELGCGCKGELGSVHGYCAEAWFKLKGNRQCEICGETAKNVTGVGENRFIEGWNETRSAGSGTNFSERTGGCWRRQSYCNFLMACLVIAFVLPWFFRVNMF